MILEDIPASGSVTTISNEPVSLGMAPVSSLMMKDVSAENVGKTLSTVSLTDVTFQTLGKFAKSKPISYDSMDEPLLFIVRVTLSE